MPLLDLPSIVHQYGALSPIPLLSLGPKTAANDLVLVRAQDALASHLLPSNVADDSGPLGRYPPASNYRRAFWRAIVDRLEHGVAQPEAVEEELEVDERIYSAYLSTLQPVTSDESEGSSTAGTTPFGGSAPPASSYKTFFFPRARQPRDQPSRSSSASPSLSSAVETSLASSSTSSTTKIALHPLHVTLAEEQKTISHGTTGLRTWGASLRLAELVLDRPADVFPSPPSPQGPTMTTTFDVLELGAGVGFLGLFLATLGRDLILLDWSPSSSFGPSAAEASSSTPPMPALKLTLTDFDERVLDRLRHNVELNGFKPAEVNVIALDWADSLPFTSSSSAALSSAPAAPNGAGATAAEIKRRLPAGIRRRPDLIVAADVVYDPSIIRPLVATLHRLLSASSTDDNEDETEQELSPRTPPSALIASTIRNETTFARFIDEAEAQGLRATELAQTAAVPRVFFGAEEGGGTDAGEVRIVRFTIA